MVLIKVLRFPETPPHGRRTKNSSARDSLHPTSKVWNVNTWALHTASDVFICFLVLVSPESPFEMQLNKHSSQYHDPHAIGHSFSVLERSRSGASLSPLLSTSRLSASGYFFTPPFNSFLFQRSQMSSAYPILDIFRQPRTNQLVCCVVTCDCFALYL